MNMQILNTHKIQHRKALIMADGCEDGKGQHCSSYLQPQVDLEPEMIRIYIFPVLYH